MTGPIDETEDKLDALDDILTQAREHSSAEYLGGSDDVDPMMLKHIFDHWGCFAQIVNSSDSLPEAPADPKQAMLSSGLSMVDYGHAIAVSPGGALFNLTTSQEANEAPQTLSERIKRTGDELVALVKKRGWEGIHVVDGHPTLLSAILYSAAQHDVALYGYEDEEGYIERRFSYEYGEAMDITAVASDQEQDEMSLEISLTDEAPTESSE